MSTQAEPHEPRPTILVVDDEQIVVEVLGRYLRREGFVVVSATTGPQAWAAAVDEQLPPSVIVLDVMLPGLDGRELCRRLRQERRLATPILFLTARGDESDRIDGLGLGADDYVVKPFSPGEVVARVKALLRRVQLDTRPVPGEGWLRGGSIALHPASRRIEVEGQLVELTAKEFDLLHVLMDHQGQVLSRNDLLDAVWDQEFLGDPSTVTVHIRRLREKIEKDPGRPGHIKSVWGMGYKFAPSVPT